MGSPAQTTSGLIARLAVEVPERVVLSDDRGRKLTARELWRQIQALAGALERCGVQRGDRVAIRATNCLEWSLWEYAAQAIAAIPVGVGLQWNDRQASEVLADCDATVLIASSADSLSGIAAERLRRCRLVCVIEPLAMAPPTSGGWRVHADLIAECSEPSFEPRCEAADVATIIYTSGSTGKPKGIAHTHARVMAAVQAITSLFPELRGGTRALSWMPMEHLFQRVLNLVSLSFAMEASVLADPRKLIDVLAALQPCYFAGVPFVYEQLLRAIDADPERFAAWREKVRVMIVGSAPIPRDVLARLSAAGFPIRQAYSTSECLVPIAANTLSENRVGSVGKPLAAYEFRLSDDGEICVRGPGVFSGYWGFEEHAGALFDAEGYFKTGDFGYLDDDGYLFVGGRGDDFFKTSTGRKVSPVEVESAYKRSPLIEHIVVFGEGRKQPIAVVQLNEEQAALLASQLGINAIGLEALSRDQRIKAAVLQAMRQHEASLDPYKRVRDIALLPRSLRVETGELTPTLKVRRDHVVRSYEALLKELADRDERDAGGEHAA